MDYYHQEESRANGLQYEGAGHYGQLAPLSTPTGTMLQYAQYNPNVNGTTLSSGADQDYYSRQYSVQVAGHMSGHLEYGRSCNNVATYQTAYAAPQTAMYSRRVGLVGNPLYNDP